MLEAVVVDDEFHSLERLKNLIKQSQHLRLAGSYSKPNNCLLEIKASKISPQVALLDIEMLGCNGMEFAERILELDREIDIVFVTAHESYAVEAFEVNALDYLLKPVTADRFQETISRLREKEGC